MTQDIPVNLADRLSDRHLRMLREESAISDAVIAARNYRSITDGAELRGLGFAPQQCRAGLLLPVHTTDGGNGVYVLRPDAPRSLDEKDKPRNPDGTYPQRVLKYEFPKDAAMRVDVPPACLAQLADPARPLWITEGQKKGDALASAGLTAIALLGVWNFKGKNAFGASTVLADLDHIAWKDRDVRIVFDSDVMEKPAVQQALKRLVEILQHRGAHVATVYLPPRADGRKQGVDDYLAAGHTVQELERLVGAPRIVPEAAPADVEILDVDAGVMTRPLAIVENHAYAATWLPAKTTETEGRAKDGAVIRYAAPRVTRGRRLFVVRDDGAIFGAARPLESLGFDLHLPEMPPLDRLWSPAGVKAFAAGARPVPAEVFGRVVDVVDRFIDFNRSLADQRGMAELAACFVLASYGLPAWRVVPFMWPNGDRGCGKTQFLTVVTELAYLGQVILSGGSFASLRDLADYGATLAFDDAEGLSDPRTTDPDKRALLLAGNRRGNTVPVKEPAADRTWRTRYVNTFCCRLFSATKLPDVILASRTIIVPLIRTPDRYRANADPLDYTVWPHDRVKLVDDLWALALGHVPTWAAYEGRVNDLAALTGRNLEPWRAILAVALWLDENGVPGLLQRMEALSVGYQSERPNLEVGDLTALVIRALCRFLTDNGITRGEARFQTAALVALAKQIAEDEELDFDLDRIDGRRVGRVLGKMRLKPDRDAKKKGWIATVNEAARWSAAYGMPFDVPLGDTLASNGTNGTNGITAQTPDGNGIREVFEL